MYSKKARWIAGLIAFCFSASPAAAWNLRGHMIVCAAAWDQLAPEVKVRAAQLLRINPDFRIWTKDMPRAEWSRAAFTRACGWADDIKSRQGYTNDKDIGAPEASRNIGYADKFQHRYWHFIDLPFSNDGTQLVEPKEPNAQSQIVTLRDALSSADIADEVKSFDLVWLMHLVGDVHQPLHATSRFSANFPKGDQGGNLVALCEQPCRNNLHAFWDDALGSGDSISAAFIAADHLGLASKDDADVLDPDGWIAESFEVAKNSVYSMPIGEGGGPFEVTADYKETSTKIAKQRAAIAAARLAKLLNNAWQ